MDDDLLSRIHRDRDWDTDDLEQFRRSFPRRTAVGTMVLVGLWGICWYVGSSWATVLGPAFLRYAVIGAGVAVHLLRSRRDRLEAPPWKPLLNLTADGLVGLWLAGIAAPWWSLLVLPGLEIPSAIVTLRVFRMHLGWARFGTPLECLARVTFAELLGYVAGATARRVLL